MFTVVLYNGFKWALSMDRTSITDEESAFNKLFNATNWAQLFNKPNDMSQQLD